MNLSSCIINTPLAMQSRMFNMYLQLMILKIKKHGSMNINCVIISGILCYVKRYTTS